MLINIGFLRKRRRELDFSQEYIAFGLNISQKAYSEIERGKTNLTNLERLNKLADLLKCIPSELCNNCNACNESINIKYEKLKQYIVENGIDIPKELL